MTIVGFASCPGWGRAVVPVPGDGMFAQSAQRSRRKQGWFSQRRGDAEMRAGREAALRISTVKRGAPTRWARGPSARTFSPRLRVNPNLRALCDLCANPRKGVAERATPACRPACSRTTRLPFTRRPSCGFFPRSGEPGQVLRLALFVIRNRRVAGQREADFVEPF